MKNVLLIAYHFPPYAGGSGVHRAASFFKYLPENGWTPHVLTVTRSAYEDPQAPPESKRATGVTRVPALDARRHLSIRHGYLKWSAIPDRWVSWALTAVPAGLLLIHRRKVDVIVVTYPIATAVLIGLALHSMTGLPLVVDFRDSMTEDDYPRDSTVRAAYRRIERGAMTRGSHFVFTAESARRMYLNRYPEISPDACTVIPNGYDEEVFAHIDGSLKRPPAGPLRLVHAGVIYPDERDPRPFFRAVSRLKKDGALGSDKLRIELRASGSEALYCNLLRELEVDDVIHLLPTIPYRAALSDMASADGLVLLQAANCNHQIPAKVYEYLRIGRPILALTSHIGDTAALLKQTGGATIADLADEGAIYRALPQFIAATAGGTHSLPGEQEVRNFSRKKQTAVLAQRLSQVVRQTLDLEAASRPSKHIRVGERPLG